MTVQYHQYANDTQLCFFYSSDPGEAVDMLNLYLAVVIEWMMVNRQKFIQIQQKFS